jgi:hypothetical protein
MVQAGGPTIGPMPLERQWERQQTPLRRLNPRERTVLMAIFVVLAIGGIATAIAGAGNSKLAPETRGCVAVANPSTMGAAMARACGAQARRWCALPELNRDTSYARVVQAACRRAGINP